MPRLIVSIDGVVITEVKLVKDKTTLGRRPYNDVVIDNLLVSGEHAALLMNSDEVYVEDLNSTNGTFVNGKSVKRQLLRHGDHIEIGKYTVEFVQPAHGGDALGVVSAPAELVEAAQTYAAAIKVLTGAGTGRAMALTKVVTTLGKPGVAVAAITRGHGGYMLGHVEGMTKPALNGSMIGAESVALKDGDLIELAGTQMQFVRT